MIGSGELTQSQPDGLHLAMHVSHPKEPCVLRPQADPLWQSRQTWAVASAPVLPRVQTCLVLFLSFFFFVSLAELTEGAFTQRIWGEHSGALLLKGLG